MTHKDDTHDDSTTDDAPSAWWLFCTALLVFTAWVGSGYFIHAWFDEPGDRGTFGDMFGAINALFSGLAFSVLIYTMILQRIELKLQRKELRQTRAELAGQKEQMEIQNGTMRRQRFEQTFFSLLDTFSSSINAMEVRLGGHPGVAYSGRSCFQYQVQKITEARSKVLGDTPSAMARYLELHGSEISSYLSMFEGILQFVESSDLNDGDKRTYVSFLGSALSTNERVLLFHFGLSHIGQDRIKGLLEKYSLLTDLYGNQYIPNELFKSYEASALCRPPKAHAVA